MFFCNLCCHVFSLLAWIHEQTCALRLATIDNWPACLPPTGAPLADTNVSDTTTQALQVRTRGFRTPLALNATVQYTVHVCGPQHPP